MRESSPATSACTRSRAPASASIAACAWARASAAAASAAAMPASAWRARSSSGCTVRRISTFLTAVSGLPTSGFVE